MYNAVACSGFCGGKQEKKTEPEAGGDDGSGGCGEALFVTSYHMLFSVFTLKLVGKKLQGVFRFFSPCSKMEKPTLCCPPCSHVLFYFLPVLFSPLPLSYFASGGFTPLPTSFTHCPTHLTAFLPSWPLLTEANTHMTLPTVDVAVPSSLLGRFNTGLD